MGTSGSATAWALGQDGRSERWFSALVVNSSDIFTVLDSNGRVKYSSPASARLLGYPEGYWLERSAFDLVHPDDLERVQTQFLAELTSPGPGQPIEFRMRAHDGVWHYVEAIGNNLLDDPEVRGIVINTRDVSDRKAAEVALLESEERYRRLVEYTPDAVAIYCERRIAYINAAGLRLLGATCTEQVVGHELLRFVPYDDREGLARALDTPSENITPLRYERILRLDGTVVEVEAVTIPTTFEGRAAAQVVARDVTDQRRAEAELARRASHDPLTGIPNRQLLQDRLRQAMAHAQRNGSTVAVLFIDLDDFKLVNDRFGHTVGDRLLVDVAKRLTGATRDGDMIARYGGDEFLVLCEHVVNEDEVRVISNRIVASLDPPFAVADHEVRISASIGAATSCDSSPDDLIHAADRAMYDAKTRPREGEPTRS